MIPLKTHHLLFSLNFSVTAADAPVLMSGKFHMLHLKYCERSHIFHPNKIASFAFPPAS